MMSSDETQTPAKKRILTKVYEDGDSSSCESDGSHKHIQTIKRTVLEKSEEASRKHEEAAQEKEKLATRSRQLSRCAYRTYVVPYRPDDPMFTQTQPYLEIRMDLPNCEATKEGSTQWLCDSVINLYGQYLVLKHAHTLLSMQMCSDHSDVTHTGTLVKALRALICAGSNARLLFVPCHSGGNHWTLFVVDKKARQVVHYDSLRPQNGSSKAFAHHKSAWERIMCLEDSSNTWVVREDACPRQENSYDCGIFVCYFMAYLAEWTSTDTDRSTIGSLSNISRLDAFQFRGSIGVLLEYFVEKYQ